MVRASSMRSRASSVGRSRSTGIRWTVLQDLLQYYRAVTTPAFATRRRTELFDAVVALFLAEGFAHLTLDEIAARLRCSKSTLYTLSASKEQLVTAATKHFFRTATDAVEDRVAAAEGARER